MIEETLGKIESRLKTADSIPDERRRELLELVAVLKSEVGALSKTPKEEAESIAECAKLSTQEATRTEQNPQLVKLSLEGLNSSVQGFEQSHPRLVQIVGAVTNTLSNLGI